MKKAYINPELDIVVLNMSKQLLAGSDVGIGSGDKDPATEGDMPAFPDEPNIFGF